ncbi:hypothetical protein [Lactobacillus crispatus]|uniref:hypothetical protein n=1 Tax=Lactobacillus crispatus TaxID=47770 RepID=UPI001FCA46AC|nr:hypothetical protein [Lactobacillus crispatus]
MNEFSLLFLFWDANFMKKSKIIFLIELVLNIIAAVFLVINNSFKNLLDVGVVFLLLLLLIWNFLRRKIEISLKLSWLNLMILPAIFTYCLNTVANVLLVKYLKIESTKIKLKSCHY